MRFQATKNFKQHVRQCINVQLVIASINQQIVCATNESQYDGLNDFDYKAPADTSMSLSLPDRCNRSISSPPPTNLPLMNTLGTVDAPVS